MFHCFYEQSGTFKNEFKKLGFAAEDYDILNDYGQTDHVIDLFAETDKAYKGDASIFDNIKEGDQIIAFFPCVRFEDQIQMQFRGTANQMQKWTQIQKLEYDLKLMEELKELYDQVTKLALVCLKRGIPLIIENPWSTTHFLVKYWCIPCSFIDHDRSATGDYYQKKTQFWFIGREPSNNFIFEGVDIKPKKKIVEESNVDRSMISHDYANRFIREYILKKEDLEKNGISSN